MVVEVSTTREKEKRTVKSRGMGQIYTVGCITKYSHWEKKKKKENVGSCILELAQDTRALTPEGRLRFSCYGLWSLGSTRSRLRGLL